MAKLSPAFLASVVFLAMSVRALAQSLVLGDTTCVLVSTSAVTGGLVGNEARLIAGQSKAIALTAFAARDLGGRWTLDPANGFQTRVRLRFLKGFSPAVDLVFRLTFLPLAGQSTKYPGATAVLLVVRCDSSPRLAYTRLLVRRDPKNWHVEEYAFRWNGRTTLMTAKFGDCILRSALQMLEGVGHPAHAALRAALNASATKPLIVGLREVYDVKSRAFGQGELILRSTLLGCSNVSEEFSSGYINGAITTDLKPLPNDSAIIKQLKMLQKQIIDQLRQELGKILWRAILAYLGLA